MPSGIARSLAWLVRHLADLLWSVAVALPENVSLSTQEEQASCRVRSEAQERVAYLERGWKTLKTRGSLLLAVLMHLAFNVALTPSVVPLVTQRTTLPRIHLPLHWS